MRIRGIVSAASEQENINEGEELEVDEATGKRLIAMKWAIAVTPETASRSAPENAAKRTRKP